MSCCGGCGGAGGGSAVPSGPILSGVLESRYADSGGNAPSAPPAIAEADVTGGTFASGGFWIVLLFVGIAAYWTDKTKRESE